MKGERDAQAKEKGEAQKAVEDLKQQVLAKGGELEKERKERAAVAERVNALEGEVEMCQHELTSLQRSSSVLKSRDDHAQSRYLLAQQINDLKGELNDKLQAAYAQVDAGVVRFKALEDELSASHTQLASCLAALHLFPKKP